MEIGQYVYARLCLPTSNEVIQMKYIYMYSLFRILDGCFQQVYK
jgi:hypothetical protein